MEEATNPPTTISVFNIYVIAQYSIHCVEINNCLKLWLKAFRGNSL